MTTKIVVIIAVSIVAVMLMFVIGRLADGKDQEQ